MVTKRKQPSKRTRTRTASQTERQTLSDNKDIASPRLTAIVSSYKRRPVLWIAVAVAIIIVIVLVIVAFAVSGSQETPPQNEESENELITEPAVESDSEPDSAPVSLTLSFAGDCTLGTDENFDYDTSFNAQFASVDDPAWFFANVYDIFSNDDLSVVNMEGTLSTSTYREDKTYAFEGDAEFAEVLVDGSIEAASLANNHSFDYGEDSYNDTMTALEDVGIATFGYERIAYFDIENVKIALIGTYELDEGLGIESQMVSNIEQAQEQGAQIIIVFAHWGIEGDYVPDDTQVELAHAAIDAGATLVVGSHPHVIQGYEKYNGRYIVYSLGNFCFGGNSNPTDKDCMIFQQTFTVTGNEVAEDDDINVIPCMVSSTEDYNDYQPTPATGSNKERIEEKIEESNQSIESMSASLQN